MSYQFGDSYRGKGNFAAAQYLISFGKVRPHYRNKNIIDWIQTFFQFFNQSKLKMRAREDVSSTPSKSHLLIRYLLCTVGGTRFESKPMY